MIDKTKYLKIIEHSPCKDKVIESSDLQAFKLDDDDGIANAIGFHKGMINKVDYFLVNNINVQLIELSDLEELVKNRQKYIDKQLTQKDKKNIRREVWKSQTDEFIKKWSGSIAAIERLYRKTNELGSNDPKYTLLIVCKNKTDAKTLDTFTQFLTLQFSGMMGNVKVCNTKMLNQFLIVQYSS